MPVEIYELYEYEDYMNVFITSQQELYEYEDYMNVFITSQQGQNSEIRI